MIDHEIRRMAWRTLKPVYWPFLLCSALVMLFLNAGFFFLRSVRLRLPDARFVLVTAVFVLLLNLIGLLLLLGVRRSCLEYLDGGRKNLNLFFCFRNRPTFRNSLCMVVLLNLPGFIDSFLGRFISTFFSFAKFENMELYLRLSTVRNLLGFILSVTLWVFIDLTLIFIAMRFVESPDLGIRRAVREGVRAAVHHPFKNYVFFLISFTSLHLACGIAATYLTGFVMDHWPEPAVPDTAFGMLQMVSGYNPRLERYETVSRFVRVGLETIVFPYCVMGAACFLSVRHGSGKNTIAAGEEP